MPYNGLLDFAKSVIPAHTVIGSALRGDTAGATARTARLITATSAKPPSADQLALMGAGATPIEAPSPMGWLLPVAGIGVVLLVFAMREKKRRR